MSKNKTSNLIASIFLIIIFVFVCFPSSKPVHSYVNGLLDLRGYEETVNFFQAKDFQKNNIVSKELIVKANKQYRLLIQAINVEFKLYLNGELTFQGGTSNNPMIKDYFTTIIPDKEKSVMRVEISTPLAGSGYLRWVKIGSEDSILAESMTNYSIKGGYGLLMLFAIIYYLYLALQDRRQYPKIGQLLYITAFFTYIFIFDLKVISVFWPQVPWSIVVKIGYIAIVWVCAGVVIAVQDHFPEDFPNITKKISLIVVVVISLMTIFLDFPIVQRLTMIPYYTFVIGNYLYILSRLYIESIRKKKRNCAGLLSTVYVILMLSNLNDMLVSYSIEFITIDRLTSHSMAFFALAFLLVDAHWKMEKVQIIAKQKDKLTETNGELNQMNGQLEQVNGELQKKNQELKESQKIIHFQEKKIEKGISPYLCKTLHLEETLELQKRFNPIVIIEERREGGCTLDLVNGSKILASVDLDDLLHSKAFGNFQMYSKKNQLRRFFNSNLSYKLRKKASGDIGLEYYISEGEKIEIKVSRTFKDEVVRAI